MKIFESRLQKSLMTTSLCVTRTDIRSCSLNALALNMRKTIAKMYFYEGFKTLFKPL